MPDRILVKDAAAQWGLTERRVASMCKDGRIPGAYKEGGTWKHRVNPSCHSQ